MDLPGAADIIATVKDPLGLTALAVLLLGAVIRYLFPPQSSPHFRLAAFTLLLVGLVGFVLVAFSKDTGKRLQEAVFLSDLDPVSPPPNVHGALQRDGVYYPPHVITFGGRTWPKGLGMHAPESGMASVKYSIPSHARLFVATAGHAEGEAARCSGNANIHVLLDGTEVFNDNVRGTNMTPVRVALRGEKIMSLLVDNAGDSNWCDHVAWADAHFE